MCKGIFIANFVVHLYKISAHPEFKELKNNFGDFQDGRQNTLLVWQS
jgi:hypothetical protein